MVYGGDAGERRGRQTMTGVAGVRRIGMTGSLSARYSAVMTFHAQSLSKRHEVMAHVNRVGKTQDRQRLAMASAAIVGGGRMAIALTAAGGAG